MSEDRFYSQVRSIMTDHSPEVPASVYTSMRRKLWWSNFTRLSATRFNMWYLLLLTVGGIAWAGLSQSKATTESFEAIAPVELNSQEVSVSAESQAVLPSKPDLNQSTESTSPKKATAKSNEVTEGADHKNVVMPAETNVTSTEEEATVQHEITQTKVENANALPTGTVNSAKPASKKGLKVTTYESAGNKK